MTKSQLKLSAQALVNRLTALGFTKTGKPMVVDQAYELVAAIEGYRNQHALRSSLEPETQGPSQDLQGWIDVANAQGWNRDSEILHLKGFIQRVGLADQLTAYAQQAANDENGAVAGDTHDCAAARVKLLKSIGYEIATSDFKLPYWVRLNDASPDFAAETEAWADAWVDATAVTVAHHKLTNGHWVRLSAEEQVKLIESCFPGSGAAMQDAIVALEARWGAEHSHYDRGDWRREVLNDDTRLSYWEWVQHAIEAHGGEDEHCSRCGGTLDEPSAERLCGNCGEPLDMAEVKLWVGLHYRVNFDAEPHDRQVQWCQRYRAATAP